MSLDEKTVMKEEEWGDIQRSSDIFSLFAACVGDGGDLIASSTAGRRK